MSVASVLVTVVLSVLEIARMLGDEDSGKLGMKILGETPIFTLNLLFIKDSLGDEDSGKSIRLGDEDLGEILCFV